MQVCFITFSHRYKVTSMQIIKFACIVLSDVTSLSNCRLHHTTSTVKTVMNMFIPAAYNKQTIGIYTECFKKNHVMD